MPHFMRLAPTKEWREAFQRIIALLGYGTVKIKHFPVASYWLYRYILVSVGYESLTIISPIRISKFPQSLPIAALMLGIPSVHVLPRPVFLDLGCFERRIGKTRYHLTEIVPAVVYVIRVLMLVLGLVVMFCRGHRVFLELELIVSFAEVCLTAMLARICRRPHYYIQY